MTAAAAPPTAFPSPEAAADVSALVVAIEKYGGAVGATDIPGSVRVAARFVERLVSTGTCRPERITFVVSYDKSDYADGRNPAELSPEPWLDKFRPGGTFAGVKLTEPAEHDNAFTEWITSDDQHGPKPEDRHFVLFWIGHGWSDVEHADEQLFLFCSDATMYVPKNVELQYLVRTVTAVAPKAQVSGFVHACQKVGDARTRDVLERQSWAVDLASRRLQAGRGLLRRVSLYYASAWGETTAMAGPDDGESTFAEAVVEWLENDENPSRDVILTADLAALNAHLAARDFRPYEKRYGPDGRYIPTREPEGVVDDGEWDDLLAKAYPIDEDRLTSGQVRWNAYCHAVGLVNVNFAAPDRRLSTLRDLFKELRYLTPADKPPPLIAACYFVAQLSDPAHITLAQWCEKWAEKRHADGENILKTIKAATPQRIDNRPYLSIAVLRPKAEPSIPAPGRRARDNRSHDMLPLLFAGTFPKLLELRTSVHWVDIVEESGSIIRDALASQSAGRDELLVEFVLPASLLGWWLEYDHPRLGDKHPVVIRDLQRARFPAVDPDAAKRHKIVWLTCRRDQESEASAIDEAEPALCLVLERRADDRQRGRGEAPAVPAELIEALDRDVPIIVSVQAGTKCASCLRGQRPEPGGGDGGCHLSAVRELLTSYMNDSDTWPGGLDALPYMLRNLRAEVARQNKQNQLVGVQVSVLNQEQGRLWAGYDKLASGKLPDVN